MNKENDQLYHYTTLKALKGILESKSIHLNNTTSCDSQEIAPLRKVLLKEINENVDLRKKLFGHFKINNQEELVEKMIEYRKNSYIFCMSYRPDNEHLWKMQLGKMQSGKISNINPPICIEMNTDFFPMRAPGYNGANDVRTEETYLFEVSYISKPFLEEHINIYKNSPLNAIISLACDIHKDNNEFEKEEEIRFLFYPGSNFSNTTAGGYVECNFEKLGLTPPCLKKNICYYEYEIYASKVGEEIPQVCMIKKIWCRNNEDKRIIEAVIKNHNPQTEIKVEVI